jgi:hypothetical protein
MIGEKRRRRRRPRWPLCLVAASAAIAGWVIVSGAALAVDGSTASTCETPAPLNNVDSVEMPTITRELAPPDGFPQHLEVGSLVFAAVFPFDTDIDGELVQSQTAFRVGAQLLTPDRRIVGGAVATAWVENDRQINLQLCIDPRALDSGEYELIVSFDDKRVPKTRVTLDVIVGSPNGRATAVAIGALALGLAGSLPLVIVLGSLNKRRSVLGELRSAWVVLVVGGSLGLIGYAWATWKFLGSEAYLTWQPSDPEDLGRFAFNGYRGAAAVIGFFGGICALVPKLRESLGKTVSGVDTDTGSAPHAEGQPPADDSSPVRLRGGRLNPIVAVVTSVALVGFALVAGLRWTGAGGGETAAVPVPGTAETSTGRSAGEVLGDAVIGESNGTAVAELLLGAGFNVGLLSTCSTADLKGTLSQVRTAETQAELVGSGGVTALANEVRSPAPVQVLIGDGSPCES